MNVSIESGSEQSQLVGTHGCLPYSELADMALEVQA